MPKTEEEKAAQKEATRLKRLARQHQRYEEDPAYREALVQSGKKGYAKLTPEQKAERLAKQRAAYALKKLSAKAPAPESLPPPPTEDEWSLSEFKAAVATPPSPVVALPLPPPPPPAPVVTEAVRTLPPGRVARLSASERVEKMKPGKVKSYATFKTRLFEKMKRGDKDEVSAYLKWGTLSFRLTFADKEQLKFLYEDAVRRGEV
jgi:hypothetical protein